MLFSRSLLATLLVSSASAISSSPQPTATPSPDINSRSNSSSIFGTPLIPKCMETCAESTSQILKITPLCSVPNINMNTTNPEEAEKEASKNSYSCMCRDKIFLRTLIGCSVQTCDDKNIVTVMTIMYELCNALGSTTFPTPERFLAALGIDTAGKPIPKSLSLDTGNATYVTNSVFPGVTATIAIGSDHPMWPTDPAILKTATDTADDGEVRFSGTGTQIVSAAKQTTTAAGGSAVGAAAASPSASPSPSASTPAGKNEGGKVAVAGSVLALVMGALLMAL
ncbi:hypothetical protein BZA77DRAFT_319627 [Pyronema omphalodes]|nr:hypothetical protein BZA77DRAFT_319627 [Pyronema omphalodes]